MFLCLHIWSIESWLRIKLSKFRTVVITGEREDRNGDVEIQMRLPFYETKMSK